MIVYFGIALREADTPRCLNIKPEKWNSLFGNLSNFYNWISALYRKLSNSSLRFWPPWASSDISNLNGFLLKGSFRGTWEVEILNQWPRNLSMKIWSQISIDERYLSIPKYYNFVKQARIFCLLLRSIKDINTINSSTEVDIGWARED